MLEGALTVYCGRAGTLYPIRSKVFIMASAPWWVRLAVNFPMLAAQVLNVSRNCLNSLPPEIGALTSLTDLDVSRNKLQVLPNHLCKLTSLTV